MIGTRVVLKTAMLGNPVGTLGYVFNEYQDYDVPDGIGIQVIFSNGEYDGFSVKEQEIFLEIGKPDWRYADYEFKNVIQVWNDYQKGYWKF